MASSTDKLLELRGRLGPELVTMVMAQTPGAMRPLVAFAKPLIDRKIDAFLERDAEEVDRTLAGIIAYLGTLRSDGAAPVLAAADGGATLELTERFTGPDPIDGGDFERLEFFVIDRLPGPGADRGGDADGQEHVGAAPVPVDAGPAAGR